MNDTQKMSEKIIRPYAQFGNLLVTLRLTAGIANQTDFAALVKSTQQTISRWESGQSRPRDKQIPLIAAVLKADAETLLAAAGFAKKTTVASFDQPFPVDALSPESFERFCHHLLDAIYPGEKVYRAGGQGHTQEGLDISVDLVDGKKFVFQCKRTGNFGPEKVLAAVAALTVKADRKVLLLTKVASPQARTAANAHPGWEIWDKDDISHKVRQLSPDDQIRLVDVFFKGQRFPLLGITEAGPWETTKEFFAAFANISGVFNHAWQLVGRTNDISNLSQAIADMNAPAVLLVGTGGSGKSRLLKQAVEEFEAKHPTVVVRFLSRSGEVTKKSLEDLGPPQKLLIVDDAHDRTDLPLLFQYAADPSSNARLVLAFRPYGLDHIKAQASNFSLVGAALTQIVLEPLTKEETEQLAEQVLKQHSGSLGAARDIARLTLDCPLATVVGAQIVAKEHTRFDFVQHEDTFRTMLFSRFQDTIAGQIGSKNDRAVTKKILRLLALLQPVHPEEKTLLSIIDQVEGVAPHDSSRILKLLAEAGVLFKRGAKFRLSPDVLADYIVEDTCVGLGGSSSGYAERVFDCATEKQIEHLLVNLGRLDWRRSNGDPSNSRLLDGVWRKLSPKEEYADPHIRAVKSVAYYQPSKAIEFAERLMREGKFMAQLPPILQNAAYNLKHVKDACEALWELGKRDNRPLNQHTEHPIRILAQLCEVQPNKPYEYNEQVVEFGLAVAQRPDAWSYAYSPYDVLKVIFMTEGHTTSSSNFSLSFRPYFISVKFVSPLWTRVLKDIVDRLSGPDLRAAVVAASALADAFRYPIGMFGAKVSPKIREQWSDIFVKGLESVETAISTKKIDPLVLLTIWRSLSWHAIYGKGSTSTAAKRIKQLLPDSLDFRTLTILFDGHGMEMRRIDAVNHERKWTRFIDGLTNDLLRAYPDAERLRAYINDHLVRIRTYSGTNASTPYVLYESLIRASVDYAHATLENALVDEKSETLRFVPSALAKLWDNAPGEARSMMRRLLESRREQLCAAVGQAFYRVLAGANYADTDVDLLKALIADPRAWVAQSAINALRALPEEKAELMINVASFANIGDSNQLADDLCVLYTWNKLAGFQLLTAAELESLFEKLMSVAELAGHWIEVFLSEASEKFPMETASFFLRRLKNAVDSQNWKYRPINHGPYIHVQLKFRKTAECANLLRIVSAWVKAHDPKDVLFNYRSRELFETMFAPFDEEIIEFFDGWLEAADARDLELIGSFIGETHHEFVFKHRPFVERFLEKAQQLDSQALKNAQSALYGSAIGGVRSGTAGEPMPRDIEMKEKSEAILQNLPRFSPAFELYEVLKKHAEENIAESLRSREEFDD